MLTLKQACVHCLPSVHSKFCQHCFFSVLSAIIICLYCFPSMLTVNSIYIVSLSCWLSVYIVSLSWWLQAPPAYIVSHSCRLQAPSVYIVSLSCGSKLHLFTLSPFHSISSRVIMETLELMRRDMANFTVKHLRPYLQQHTIEYESKKFAEYFETQRGGFLDRFWYKSEKNVFER